MKSTGANKKKSTGAGTHNSTRTKETSSGPRVSFDMRSNSNYTSNRQLPKLDRKMRQDNPKEVKLLC